MWGSNRVPQYLTFMVFIRKISSNLIKASIYYKKKGWIARPGEWLKTEERAVDKPPGDEEAPTIDRHSPTIA